MPRATTTERSKPMKRTRNGILIPDVPIMAGGNLPNAVKGFAEKDNPLKDYMVDMELPSGFCWAKCDINTAKPLNINDTPFTLDVSLFSWGNTDAHNVSNGQIDYNFSENNYNQTIGATYQGDLNANADNNVAMKYLGDKWRIPSEGNVQELLANTIYIDANGEEIAESTTSKIISINGINGIYLQSRHNGNRLFFSAVGFAQNASMSVYNVHMYRQLSGYKGTEFGRVARAINNVETNNLTRTAGLPIRAIYVG